MWIAVMVLMSYGPEAEVPRSIVSFVKGCVLSEDFRVRRQAYYHSSQTIVGYHRKALRPLLLDVIKKDPLMPLKTGPFNDERADFSPKNVSLYIMAEWNDPELVSLFMDHIDYQTRDPHMLVWTASPLANYVAVRGLINIGKPALEACLRELAQNHSNPRRFSDYSNVERRHDNYVHVIFGILGYKDAKKHLEVQIEKLSEQDPDRAANLETALHTLAAYRNVK